MKTSRGPSWFLSALVVVLVLALAGTASAATQSSNGYTVTDTVTYDSTTDPANPTTTFKYDVTVASPAQAVSHIDLEICPNLTATSFVSFTEGGAWVSQDGSVPTFPTPLVKWDELTQSTGTVSYTVVQKGLVEPIDAQFLIKSGSQNPETYFQVQGPGCDPQHGRLIIDKETDPAGDPQSFDFSAPAASAPADQNFGLADGSAPKSISVAPGAYDVTEATLAGWDFTNVTCDDGDSAQSGDRKVTANVASGETVTCTFRNAKQATTFTPPDDPIVPLAGQQQQGQQQPQGQQQVLGDRVTPGSARLAAATGCRSRPLKVTIRGRSIRRVVFTVDGKRITKVRASQAGTVYSITIDPRKYKAGSHAVKAVVTFTAASGTRPKTLRSRFSRCVRAAQPAFTG